MIDRERLAAFALLTAATRLAPGVSTVFLVGRTLRGNWRTGALYIAAGARLSRAMAQHTTRRRIDITIGIAVLAISCGVLIQAPGR